MNARVYLDYNAAAPLRPEARAAAEAALALTGVPSSVHAEGRRARAVIEMAREQIAALVGAEPRGVIFTSGATEANVTALSPRAVSPGAPERAVCFVSAIEHPSVIAGGRFAADALRTIPVTPEGVADLDALERMIAALKADREDAPFMVALMAANNETGAIQPVAEAAALVRQYGGMLHVDAVQAAGKIPLDIAATGAHTLSLSAQKTGGPLGVGALVLAPDVARLGAPLLTGGGQELRRRAGTENISGIAGFGAAAEAAGKDTAAPGRMRALRDRLEAEIAASAPGAVIFAQGAERLPNTACFAVAGMKAETLLIALDLEGIAVSSGSACSSGKVEPSHVLAAMGVDPGVAQGALRVSLGWRTRESDIDRFLAVWRGLHAQFRQARAAA